MTDVRQTISKQISVTVEAEITTNDIFNWLTSCNNADALRYLGKTALNRATAIENPDNDDFRSMI